jgi:AraC-like DNA-binding protein
MATMPDSPEILADPPTHMVNLLGPPGEFADYPVLGLDASVEPRDLLSEVLRSARLNGERIVAYGPLETFSVGFAGIGTLHIIDEGEVVLRVDGVPQVERASHGDVILIPRGDPHHIEGEVPQAARWLCGTFTIGDPQASHLLASLPAAIILRGDRGPALEGLEVARRMLLFEMESPSQGSAVMIARILDLLFIQILRAWAAGTEAEPNWLAGALDPQIGLALTAVHRDPGHDWKVEELAQVCCLSRSAFAARFVARVGMPPAAYLAHVRLDAATDLLRDTALPVTLIAAKVGYTSEAAFSRAFKRRYGAPPAGWRRDIRARLS